jgi:hypothetical protein
VTPNYHFGSLSFLSSPFRTCNQSLCRTFVSETEDGDGYGRMHASVGVVIISDNKRGFYWGVCFSSSLRSDYCVCSSLD